MSKKFSILVPVYMVEKYIRECIESVLSQTYTDFELLLVDDGSTDNSGTICDEYEKKDPRIKCYHNPNKGLIYTRRYAIEHASGEYYVFLDSDDMLKQNALERINEAIEKYHCDCVIYGYEKVQDGQVISQSFHVKEICLSDKTEICRNCFFDMNNNGVCRKAVKASVFHGLDYSPYYHIQLGEDLLQSLEIYKYSKSIAFIPDILYEYRMNPNSLTHEKKNIEIDNTVRKKTLEYLNNESGFSEADFNRYRDLCIKIFIADLIDVILSKESTMAKTVFERLRSDDYYISFLQKGITDRKKIGLRSVIFDLFKHKKDRLLIAFVKRGKQLKQILN